MRFPECLANAYDFISKVFKKFLKDNGGLIAAAVAFFIFISLIPLLLLFVSALGYILGSVGKAENIIFDFLHTYAPALTSQSKEGLKDVVASIIYGRGTIGGIGLIGLIWTGSSAFTNLHLAVNIAWGTPNDRGFVKTRLLSLGLLLGVGVMLLATFGITTALNIIWSKDVSVFGISPGDIPFIWTFLAYVVPVLVTIAAFTLMYKVLPTRPEPFSTALISGVTAGVLWELAKYTFSWYITRFAYYSAVYGSLAGLIIAIIWIYYASIIMILAAEVGAVYGEHIGARHRNT